jgi:hypothetical protein
VMTHAGTRGQRETQTILDEILEQIPVPA